MIRFYLINFLFNCCLRLEFCCLDFSTDSVVETNPLNMLFKGCANFKKFFFCDIVIIVGASVDNFYEMIITSSFPMIFDENFFLFSFLNFCIF